MSERDPFDVRLEAAEHACRAWGRWLSAFRVADTDEWDNGRLARERLFEQAQVTLRDWWAAVQQADW